MPRSSAGASSSKRQALHYHQSHQNGNLPPMKRPSRSGSTSNGSGSAAPAIAAPTLSPSQQPPNQQPPPASSQFLSASVSRGGVNVYGIGWDGNQNGRAYPDGLGDDVVEAFVNGTHTPEHGKIDFDPSGKVTMAGTMPSTILPAFPLLDTIMLLILFLQLPSTVLTIIYFLFASLTFVPPSATLLSASAASPLPSITNLLLQGSNGAPSLLTILFADVLVALLSMFLWPSARAFLIEFAQAVIAISLGAGHSHHGGGTLRNTAVCAGVMGSVKVVQARFRLADAWDAAPLSVVVLYDAGAHTASEKMLSSTGWIQNAVAIHIVAQWIMRATRRWLMRPEVGDSLVLGGCPGAKDGPIPSGKQIDKDPEAAVGALSQPMERQGSAGIGGKRKKKSQIQDIRKIQPLWAALASTMVHVAKEVEQSKISSAASNPNALEIGVISNESTSGGEDVRVWITKIGSTDVGFAAGFLGVRSDGEDGYEIHGAALTNGIDGSGKDGTFPLFVRVNGIVWTQSEICKYFRGGGVDRENGVITGEVEEEWVVDITGLTGSTEYDFEFVKKGGRVVYQASACTMPAQASSTAAATPAAKQLSRPLSPITTLLNTLAQANSCLVEQKNRLKVAKKTQRSVLSDIRKETEKNRSLLGNDRGDERAFRRILALKESIKRADEETEKMSRELQGLQNLPEELKAEWKHKKKSWREERDRLLSTQSQASEKKQAAERTISAVECETANLVQKKEKLTAKLGKFRADLENLEQEHQQHVVSREKKETERARLERHRLLLEKEFSDAICRLEQKVVDYRMHSADNWATFYAHQASLQSQLPPSTPEGGLQGANSNRNSLHISTPPGLLPPHQGSYAASSSSLPIGSTSSASSTTNRTRSSSLLSRDSIVTNMSDQERAAPSSFPRGHGLEHVTAFLPGMMMSGSSLVTSPVSGLRGSKKR